MNKLYVDLSSFDNISLFVQATNQVQEKMNLKSDGYVINAKSLMGIYSLNIAEPVLLEIKADKFPKTFLKQIHNCIIE